METLWFWLVSVMVAIYVVMDGFDFGAGILHLFVAKSNEERREVLAAIGPLWDGNEVWLLAGGGSLFLAFPKVLQRAFRASTWPYGWSSGSSCSGASPSSSVPMWRMGSGGTSGTAPDRKSVV